MQFIQNNCHKKKLSCFGSEYLLVLSFFENGGNDHDLLCVSSASDEKPIADALAKAFEDANKNADIALIPMQIQTGYQTKVTMLLKDQVTDFTAEISGSQYGIIDAQKQTAVLKFKLFVATPAFSR